jgi:hypothetical protein
MLTYPPGTSTIGLADGALSGGIAGRRLKQQIEQAQQAKGDFLGLIVGNILPEFLPVNGFEFFDRLAAQLSWRIHVSQITGASVLKKGRQICRVRHLLRLRATVLVALPPEYPHSVIFPPAISVFQYVGQQRTSEARFFVEKLPCPANFLSYRVQF